LAVLLTAGCSKKESQLISNEKDGWSISIPKEFVKRSVQLPPGISQYMGPDEEGYRVNVVIESFAGQETAAEVGKAIAKMPPKGLVVQEQAPYDLPGGKGYTVRGTVANGTESQRQVYLNDHGICVMLTLTTGTKTFDKWDDVFHESLTTFKWTKK